MIEAYRKLWKSRTGAESIETQEELEQKIQMELKDELTHPRVRKSKTEKLELALQRIEQSDLNEEQKFHLSSLYKKMAAQID